MTIRRRPLGLCPRCHGRGLRRLPLALSRVWHALSPAVPRTAAELALHLGTTRQAVAYQLYRLGELGAARRVGARRTGRRPALRWVRVRVHSGLGQVRGR